MTINNRGLCSRISRIRIKNTKFHCFIIIQKLRVQVKWKTTGECELGKNGNNLLYRIIFFSIKCKLFNRKMITVHQEI